MGIEKGTIFLYSVKCRNKTQRKKIPLCLILYVSSYPRTPHIATSKWVLLPMNFFAARSKKVSMPSSRRRNRGRLTVRQLVAGGWGAPDGAVGIGTGIGWPPHRHFDQSGEISRQNGAGGWGAPDGAVASGWWLVWFLVPSYKLLATSYLHTRPPTSSGVGQPTIGRPFYVQAPSCLPPSF